MRKRLYSNKLFYRADIYYKIWHNNQHIKRNLHMVSTPRWSVSRDAPAGGPSIITPRCVNKTTLKEESDSLRDKSWSRCSNSGGCFQVSGSGAADASVTAVIRSSLILLVWLLFFSLHLHCRRRGSFCSVTVGLRWCRWRRFVKNELSRWAGRQKWR